VQDVVVASSSSTLILSKHTMQSGMLVLVVLLLLLLVLLLLLLLWAFAFRGFLPSAPSFLLRFPGIKATGKKVNTCSSSPGTMQPKKKRFLMFEY
jgi:cytoskeletal protein RodZ